MYYLVTVDHNCMVEHLISRGCEEF